MLRSVNGKEQRVMVNSIIERYRKCGVSKRGRHKDEANEGETSWLGQKTQGDLGG